MDPFLTLQWEIKERLEAHEYISDASAATPRPISVVVEDMKDIQARINKAVATANGLAVIVMTAGGKIAHPNEIPHVFEPATIVLRVLENPVINRSSTGVGEQGSKVANAILRILAGVTLPSFNGPLYGLERAPGNDPKYPSHDVFMALSVPLPEGAPTRTSYVVDDNGHRVKDDNGNFLIA